MITLYAFGRVHAMVHGLTRDLRVQWALEELELPYHVRALDHTGGEMSQPEFGRISPFHQLPVIEDDGLILAESGAILVYLADKAGALMPVDPRGRAEVVRWCFAALTTIEPVVQMIALMDMEQKTDDATKARRASLAGVAGRSLAALEDWLGEHAYGAGAEFSAADILLTTVLRLARRTHLLADYPRCEKYRLMCEARPAWQRTVELYETRVGAEPGAVERAAEPN